MHPEENRPPDATGSDRARGFLKAAEELLATDLPRSLDLAREALGNTDHPQIAADALLLIGNAEHRQGRLKAAVDALQQAKERFVALGATSSILTVVLALVRVQRDLGAFEAAANLCDETLELARTLRNPEAEVDALNLRAGVCDALGEYVQALDYLEQAIGIARVHDMQVREAKILNNLGSLHTVLGDHARALESLTTAYGLLQEAAPGSRTQSENLLCLGHLYRQMRDPEEASKFFTSAWEVSQQAEDHILAGAALNNLANTLSASGDWVSARALFEQALELARETGVRPYEIDNMDGLGQVHAARGEHGQALAIHLQVLEIAREIGDREGEVDALLNLGRDYLALSEPRKSIEVLQDGLSLAQRLGSKHSIYQAHEILSVAHEQEGDLARALQHSREFHQVKEEVFNEEGEQKTRQMAIQFDLERARNEAERYRLRTEITQRAREEAEAKVRERTRELEEAQQEIVTRLAIAAEFRDDATGEHIWRVGRNAAAIAKELGWPDEDVRLMFSAARLHDIGKIGISDMILLKPGKLSGDECESMRDHTTIGVRILSGGRSRLLRLAEEIALAHHERWDGKGYPLGLAGEAIPIAARIVAVADVLDALTHARPYKQAWPVPEALAEIERQAGHQFDPKVVDACLQVFGPQGELSPLDAVDEISTVV